LFGLGLAIRRAVTAALSASNRILRSGHSSERRVRRLEVLQRRLDRFVARMERECVAMSRDGDGESAVWAARALQPVRDCLTQLRKASLKVSESVVERRQISFGYEPCALAYPVSWETWKATSDLATASIRQ